MSSRKNGRKRSARRAPSACVLFPARKRAGREVVAVGGHGDRAVEIRSKDLRLDRAIALQDLPRGMPVMIAAPNADDCEARPDRVEELDAARREAAVMWCLENPEWRSLEL